MNDQDFLYLEFEKTQKEEFVNSLHKANRVPNIVGSDGIKAGRNSYNKNGLRPIKFSHNDNISEFFILESKKLSCISIIYFLWVIVI